MNRLVLATAALLGIPAALTAQRPLPADTFDLDPVVVTAERARTPLIASVAAISRITASELRRFPLTTVADALRIVPGFALVDFDGQGGDPQLMVRGFYGAGEVEYLVVLLDGRPVNQLQSGIVAWDALPLSSVRAIEVVRGGTSSLYGDAAIGGIMNIITRDDAAQDQLQVNAAAAAHGTWRADAGVRFDGFALTGAASTTDGARAHAGRSVLRIGATVPLLARADALLTLAARSHRRDFDEPGPLLESRMDAQRMGSDAFFRFDHTRDDTHALAVDWSAFSGRARASASLLAEFRDARIVRTLALSPEFADTKQRELQTARAGASAQLELDDTPLPGQDRVVIGTDFTGGTIDSRYYRVLAGPRLAYETATGERGMLDASGSGSRTAAATFADYSVRPLPALRLALGVRFDRIHDRYEPADEASTQATHSALSPRAGVNLQYADRGSVYLSAGRSFRAPTLDQLYDQRSFPIPVPPFSVTTSNAALKPAFGTQVEAGLQHALGAGALRMSASLSAYQMDMEDELDFDVATLRYLNIGRSRHRGIEAGLQLHAAAATSFVNYTRQSPTARTEERSGRQLKNIPRHVVNAGFSQELFGAVATGITLTHARGAYIDDDNTRRLDDWTRVDARASYSLRGVTLFASVRNLLAAEYSTVAFFDPAGTGQVYHYPAAGRTLELGLRTAR